MGGSPSSFAGYKCKKGKTIVQYASFPFAVPRRTVGKSPELALQGRLHLGKTQINFVFLSVCTTFARETIETTDKN